MGSQFSFHHFLSGVLWGLFESFLQLFLYLRSQCGDFVSRYLVLSQVFWSGPHDLGCNVVSKLTECIHLFLIFYVQLRLNLKFGDRGLEPNVLIISLVDIYAIFPCITVKVLVSECKETSLRTRIFYWSLEIIIFNSSDIVLIYFYYGNSSVLADEVRNA